MSDLIWSESPELRRPLLLVAFEGVFDAAESATSALRWISERADSSTIGEIDPERFYNFQESRPMARIDDDGQRVIDWPGAQVRAARTGSVRDLVIMTGTEPHLRWGTFADHVVEVARRSRCEMVVTVGAMVAMVPHTRPFGVIGSAIHPELARRLHLSKPSYEGPTSLIGVLNAHLENANIPVISLRVQVPHYVPGPPNPKATRALLRRLQQTTGVTTDYEELDGEVSDWQTQVDNAVASDDESRDYVARLERQVDSDEELLPSGDDLAAELEAFLRDEGRDADADADADADEAAADGADGAAAEETDGAADDAPVDDVDDSDSGAADEGSA